MKTIKEILIVQMALCFSCNFHQNDVVNNTKRSTELLICLEENDNYVKKQFDDYTEFVDLNFEKIMGNKYVFSNQGILQKIETRFFSTGESLFMLEQVFEEENLKKVILKKDGKNVLEPSPDEFILKPYDLGFKLSINVPSSWESTKYENNNVIYSFNRKKELSETFTPNVVIEVFDMGQSEFDDICNAILTSLKSELPNVELLNRAFFSVNNRPCFTASAMLYHNEKLILININISAINKKVVSITSASTQGDEGFLYYEALFNTIAMTLRLQSDKKCYQ